MTQIKNEWITVDVNELAKKIGGNYYEVVLVIKDSIERGTVYTAKVDVPEEVEAEAEQVAVGLLKDAIKMKANSLYREQRYESKEEFSRILIALG